MGLTKPIEQYLFSNLLIRIHVFMYLKDIIRGGFTMMNKKEFTETIMVRLAERCPDFSFETTNVIKRNDEKLIGIIGRTSHALCPTVYIEPFYQNYRQGMSADEVIDRMAEIF